MRVPTATIETENGPVVINQSDFDEKIHKLAVDKPTNKPAKKPAKKTAVK